MFIKLQPEQLVKIWDMLKLAIAGTFVQRTKCTGAYLTHMLCNLLSGKSQCWVGFRDVDGTRKLTSMLITRLAIEDAIGEKVLFIDCLYGYNGITDEEFETGWNIIADFAKKSGCGAVVSLTDNKRVVSTVSKMNFTTRHYIVREV